MPSKYPELLLALVLSRFTLARGTACFAPRARRRSTKYGFPLFLTLVLVGGCADPVTVKDRNGREYRSLRTLEQVAIDYPVRTLAADQNFVYLFDEGSQAIYRYDHQLLPIDTFGQAGPGPEEFRKVRNLGFSKSGDLIALDAGQYAVKTFSRADHRLIDFYKPPVSFEKGILAPSGETIIFQRTGPEFTLDFFQATARDTGWQLTESFPLDTIFNRFPGSSIRDDGFFAASATSLYYVSYLTANSYKFDAAGRLLARGRAVHEIVKPEVILEAKFAAPGNSEIYVVSVAANDDILALVNRLPDAEGRLVLDGYHAADLSYAYSFSLPYLDDLQLESVGQIVLRGDTLFAASENHLTTFLLER